MILLQIYQAKAKKLQVSEKKNNKMKWTNKWDNQMKLKVRKQITLENQKKYLLSLDMVMEYNIG